MSKVNEFCQEGPRTIIILSAYGGVCNATIQRAGSTDESGTIFFEVCSKLESLLVSIVPKTAIKGLRS